MNQTHQPTTTGNGHAKFLGITPMDERKRFIKFLNESGFTIDEIRDIYPSMSRMRISVIIKGKNSTGLW